MTLDDDVARLARTRPFSLLPREAVQLVAFSSRKRRLKAGEFLFHADEPGDEGYFLHSGAVLLAKKGGGPDEEKRVAAGALIGESALYAPVVRQVEARVAEDAVVTAVPRETFRRVLAEFPAAADQGARRARRARPAAGRRARRRANPVARHGRPESAGPRHDRQAGERARRPRARRLWPTSRRWPTRPSPSFRPGFGACARAS